MEENQKKKSNEPRDYKERFEFVLTTGGNIICQRYFKINNFNEKSLYSYDLTSAIRSCVGTIDKELKDKSQVYLELYAPSVFDTKEEMEKFTSDPSNWRRYRLGQGIVVRGDEETDYSWGGKGEVKALGFKFDNGEISENSPEVNKTTYKFAFKVDGKEACAVQWDGYYPKFIRDKIDLSNKWGRFNNTDLDRLSMEQYLLYRITDGRKDLVYGLIKAICVACSYYKDEDYTMAVKTKNAPWGFYEDNLPKVKDVVVEKANEEEIIAEWNKDSERALYGVLKV